MRRILLLLILILLVSCEADKKEDSRDLVLVYSDVEKVKDQEERLINNFKSNASDHKNFLYGINLDVNHDNALDEVCFFSYENYESLITYNIYGKNNEINLIGKIFNIQVGDINGDKMDDFLIELELGGTSGTMEYMVLQYVNKDLQIKKIEDFLDLESYKVSIENDFLLIETADNSQRLNWIQKYLKIQKGFPWIQLMKLYS
ncbi:MAG: hypothetical protein JXR88_04260 [Clostridia bacterium]|nr:hypothetical protein [Clostridia bacterium]